MIMKTSGTYYTVGEISALTGVTRKTLFYYDRTGLLKPVRRYGSQQHKLYDAESLIRLKEIIEYREAGLSIAEIRALVNDPDCDKAKILRGALERIMSLRDQKEEEIRRLKRMIELL